MTYLDLDLHLSLLINEMWAKRDHKRLVSEYMPQTAQAAADMLRRIKQLERKEKKTTTKKDKRILDEHCVLYEYLHCQMRLESAK